MGPRLDRPSLKQPLFDWNATKQPLFDWNATDKYAELINFMLEVNNIFQTHATNNGDTV